MTEAMKGVMTMDDAGVGPAGRVGGREPIFRWECPCGEPPVLLATYSRRGPINIKVRDRYWHVLGCVQAICPRCGAEHVLDLRRGEPEGVDPGARSAEGASRS